MRPLLILLLILSQLVADSAFGQPTEGVYISSHDLRVGNLFAGRTRIRDIFITKKMRAAFLDSVYTKRNKILQVYGNDSLRLWSDIRGEALISKIAADGSDIYLGTDSYQLQTRGVSKILLIAQYSDSLKWETHFQKLEPSALDRSSNILPSEGSHLRIVANDSTGGEEIYLDFTGEKNLIVTGSEDDKRYTFNGRWQGRWIGNYWFFAFYDYHFDQIQLYHFYAQEGELMMGRTFGKTLDLDSVPSLFPITLSSVDTLEHDEREEIEQLITGSWTAVNDPLFYDTAIEFGFLSYQSFELDLESDGSFTSRSSGSLLKYGDSIPLDDSLSGKWEVSSTGKYISLNPHDGPTHYLAIENLSSDTLDAFYIMKTLSEFPDYNVYENRRVELRR